MAALNASLLVCGLGLRACAQLSGLQALWLQARADSPALPPAPQTVAVLAGKEHHPALLAWLTTLHPVPRLLALPAARLAGQAVPTQSPRLLARYGTGSVAEALALAAAGPGACLLRPRSVAADGSATLALAYSETKGALA